MCSLKDIFWREEIFNSDEVCYQFVLFNDHAVVLYIRYIHTYNPRSKKFSTMFSSRNVILLTFMLYMYPFWVIFLCSFQGRYRLDFFLCMNTQVFQHQWSKRLLFLHWTTFSSLLKASCPYKCGSISVLFFTVNIHLAFLPKYHMSWLLKVLNDTWIKYCSYSNVLFFTVVCS